MTKRLKPYPSYKDSGVEWLGEVPEGWELRRLGSSVRGCINGIWGAEPDGVNDLPCVRVADFDRFRLRVRLEKPTLRAISKSERNNRLLREGDLLLEKSGGGDMQPVGVVILYDFDERAVCSNFIARMPVDEGYNSTFLVYLHSCLYSIRLNIRSIKQTTGIQNLDSSSYLSELVAFPPLPEQTAIVRFLGYMDRRIQRLIRAKQKLIKLLEEQKQAIIHEAVTGRIDVRTGKPYPSYKDSGVEWLGKVPEHWEVGSVKRHYSIQLGKMLQPRPERPEDVEVPYLKAKHVQWFSVSTSEAPKMWASPSEIEQFGIGVGDLLVCEGGEGGRTGIVHDVPLGFIIQNALHRVRASDSCSNEFLQFVMYTVSATGWFDALNSKATIAHFTREKFGALGMSFPPLPEQTAIVQYLDSHLANLSRSMESFRRAIDLLQEYRTRLISDVVTGKVDVREPAALLPDEPEDKHIEEPDTEDETLDFREPEGAEEEGEE